MLGCTLDDAKADIQRDEGEGASRGRVPVPACSPPGEPSETCSPPRETSIVLSNYLEGKVKLESSSTMRGKSTGTVHGGGPSLFRQPRQRCYFVAYYRPLNRFMARRVPVWFHQEFHDPICITDSWEKALAIQVQANSNRRSDPQLGRLWAKFNRTAAALYLAQRHGWRLP